MGNAQELALETEKLRQNQALFRKYTDVDGALKNHIVTEAEPVLISPMGDQLLGFGQVSILTIIQQMFYNYRVINENDLKENGVKMMGPYYPAEPHTQLIEQLEKGREFA